MPYRYLKDVLV